MDLCKKDEPQPDRQPVVCYFSGDITESGRQSPIPGESLHKLLDEALQEDKGRSSLQDILLARSQLKDKGFDDLSIEEINNLKMEDLLDPKLIRYDSLISQVDKNIPVGLTNAPDQLPDDWLIAEKYGQDKEPYKVVPTLREKKSVLHMDKLNMSKKTVNKEKMAPPPFKLTGFETLVKLWDLDNWRLNC